MNVTTNCAISCLTTFTLYKDSKSCGILLYNNNLFLRDQRKLVPVNECVYGFPLNALNNSGAILSTAMFC